MKLKQAKEPRKQASFQEHTKPRQRGTPVKTLVIREPISGGLLLSYKCTSECKHCMYAGSTKWDADWISREDAEKILTQLSGKIKPSPYGPNKVGVNYGLHFTGGEPFLNFSLLLKCVRIAYELQIPSTFVETNCHWCTSDEVAKSKLQQLKSAGLNGMLISVNPFILEHVPFERTGRALRASIEVFQDNTMVYQEFFYHQFIKLGIKKTLSFERYLDKAGLEGLYYAELLPAGRLLYKLGHLFKKYPAKHFFAESCRQELERDWHVHVDNYGNYMTGYCGGISLGDAHDLGLLCQGIDLRDYPVLEALMTKIEGLFELGEKSGYKELPEGYISKCHLCTDIRKHLIQQPREFKELAPKKFYSQITGKSQ